MDKRFRSTPWDRRRFLTGAIAGTAIARLFARPQSTRLRAIAIDHVSYESADYKKTRDFYVGVFGFQVSEEDDRQLYLWAGDALLSAKNTPAARNPFVDHFGVTVDPWDSDVVTTALQTRNLVARFSRGDPHDPQNRSAFTRDANGFSLQLEPKDLAAKPSAVPSRAALKPVGLNHISYLCPDYKRTRDFYRELLGTPVTNDDGQQAYLWFGEVFMIVRSSGDSRPAPIIDRVGWTLADWDPDRVAAVLRQHGLDARRDALGKSILTKDLNGYPVEFCSGDLATKR